MVPAINNILTILAGKEKPVKVTSLTSAAMSCDSATQTMVVTRREQRAPVVFKLTYNNAIYSPHSHTLCICLVALVAERRLAGDFFLACKDFGRMFDHSFPACALNFFYFFFIGD